MFPGLFPPLLSNHRIISSIRFIRLDKQNLIYQSAVNHGRQFSMCTKLYILKYVALPRGKRHQTIKHLLNKYIRIPQTYHSSSTFFLFKIALTKIQLHKVTYAKVIQYAFMSTIHSSSMNKLALRCLLGVF